MQRISLHSIDNSLLIVDLNVKDKTRPLLEVTGKCFIDRRIERVSHISKRMIYKARDKFKYIKIKVVKRYIKRKISVTCTDIKIEKGYFVELK